MFFITKLPSSWLSKKKKLIERAKRIKFMKLVKMGFYCIEIISMANAFGSLYDTLRLRVDKVVHCFAYGRPGKCNWGIWMCFIGLICAMYSLTTIVFEEFMKIPEEMKFHESPAFLGFKLGLTFTIRRRLYKWHIEKMKRKYFSRRHNPGDLIMKMVRFRGMIGADLRNVRTNLIRANTVQFMTLIIVIFLENREVREIIKEEVGPYVLEFWKNVVNEWRIMAYPYTTTHKILAESWKDSYPVQLEQTSFFRELREEFLELFFY